MAIQKRRLTTEAATRDSTDQDRIAFSVKEASRVFCISPASLYVLMKNRVIGVKHFGRKTLLSGDDLRRWYQNLPSEQPSKFLPPLARRGGSAGATRKAAA